MLKKENILQVNFLFIWNIWRQVYYKKSIRYSTVVNFKYYTQSTSEKISFHTFIGLNSEVLEDIRNNQYPQDKDIKPHKYCNIPHLYESPIIKDEFIERTLRDKEKGDTDFDTIRKYLIKLFKKLEHSEIGCDYSILNNKINTCYNLSDIYSKILGEEPKINSTDPVSSICTLLSSISYNNYNKYEHNKDLLKRYIDLLKEHYSMACTYFNHLEYTSKDRKY